MSPLILSGGVSVPGIIPLPTYLFGYPYFASDPCQSENNLKIGYLQFPYYSIFTTKKEMLLEKNVDIMRISLLSKDLVSRNIHNTLVKQLSTIK